MELAYSYTARGKLGEVQGVIFATRVAYAKGKLKKMGLTPKTVRFSPIHTLFGGAKTGFDLKDMEQFYRYMARLHEKGLPLGQAISGAIDTISDPKLKGALGIMSDATGGSGMTLSQAMTLAGFAQRDADLVMNGEKSSHVSKVLNSLADELKRTQQARRTIRKLLMMPTFMYFLMSSILYFAIVYMAPRVYSLFKNVLTNVELPEYALLYYQSCELFNTNLLVSSVLYWAGVFGFALFARSDYVKRLIDLVKPVRVARQKADYAALFSSFSLMIGAGIHYEDIAKGLAKAAGTKEARTCFNRLAFLVRDGHELDDAVAIAKFPIYVVNGFAAAKKSLSMEAGTKDLSEQLLVDVDVFSSRAAFWIEAGLYLVAALFVVGFAMLTAVPLFLSIFKAI